jgi:hypothetical protein
MKFWVVIFPVEFFWGKKEKNLFCYLSTLLKPAENGSKKTTPYRVHRQNVEVKNADGNKRRWTKRRMGQNFDGKNVEW